MGPIDMTPCARRKPARPHMLRGPDRAYPATERGLRGEGPVPFGLSFERNNDASRRRRPAGAEKTSTRLGTIAGQPCNRTNRRAVDRYGEGDGEKYRKR